MSHATHTMHAHSLEAYASLKPDARRAAVLAVYRGSTFPLTDRQVMEALGFTDGNAVKPRISELVEDGKLYECGKVKDHITNKTVRVCTNTSL